MSVVLKRYEMEDELDVKVDGLGDASDDDDVLEPDDPEPDDPEPDDPEPDDPDNPKVKEKERTLMLKMACIDNQCMICGWPFRWSGGDRTHLGAMLYKIEQIYVSLTNHSYQRLFCDYHRSHVLHKHSRRLLAFKLLDLPEYSKPANLWDIVRNKIDTNGIMKPGRDVAANTRLISVQRSWAKKNMEVLVENIALQVVYTLDTAWATYTAFMGEHNSVAAGDPTKKSIYEWLESRLLSLSTTDSIVERDTHYKNLIHSACVDCNVTQTMLFSWETVIQGLYGIRKADANPSKDKTSKERNHEMAEEMMKSIVFFVYLQLEKRYPFLKKKKRSDVILVFIKQLFCLNMQTMTACFQDSSALDPPPNKKGSSGPYPKAMSLRHRYKAYAAFSACAVMHVCIKMSLDITNTIPVSETEETAARYRQIPASIPFLTVCLAMDLDQFWKYVVVECAEYGFSTYEARTRKTVHQFYFGIEGIMRFKVNDSADMYHHKMHGLFKNSIGGITARMVSAQGLAMHMFALGDMGDPADCTFNKMLKKIPKHLENVGLLLPTASQGPPVMVSDLFKLDPKYDAPEIPLKILSGMRACLLSHAEAIKNQDVITSSTLLSTHTPPGVWCKLMRARTHKNAVEKLLRMPLLFNEMVTYHVSTCVRYLVQKLLASPDPLEDAT
jgi:hypothetical protein